MIPLNTTLNDYLGFKFSNTLLNMLGVLLKLKLNLFSFIWHNNVPYLIIVSLWRLMQRYFPTYDILLNKGLALPSHYQCCSYVENMNHVFIFGATPAKV